MGTMNIVCCTKCGYRSDTLCGVGGDVGMRAEVTVTVACPEDGDLHDTDAGHYYDLYPVEHRFGGDDDDFIPAAGPCPVCGKRHPGWDSDRATCPRCGSDGCQIESVGLWD